MPAASFMPASTSNAADQHLVRSIRKALRDSAYYELRHVRCDVHAGVAMLAGQVSCFYLKQIAQHVVSEVEGVLCIENSLHVHREEIL